MGKYIIELERGETAYKTVDSNSTPLIQLLAPTPYAEPDLEQVKADAYNDGYKAGRETEEVRQKLGQPDIEQVRKEAYDKGYDDATAEISSCEQAIAEKAYQKGLSDMLGCVDKINSMSHKEQEECFGRTYLVNILELEPSEIIEKIRQYEHEKEEQGGLRQSIKTFANTCGYTLDEIAAVLEKMKEK